MAVQGLLQTFLIQRMPNQTNAAGHYKQGIEVTDFNHLVRFLHIRSSTPNQELL
jgi:hypothetical protein